MRTRGHSPQRITGVEDIALGARAARVRCMRRRAIHLPEFPIPEEPSWKPEPEHPETVPPRIDPDHPEIRPPFRPQDPPIKEPPGPGHEPEREPEHGSGRSS